MIQNFLFAFNRFSLGGAEFHTLNLAKHLAASGHNCALVAVKHSANDKAQGFYPAVTPRPGKSNVSSLINIMRKKPPTLVLASMFSAIPSLLIASLFMPKRIPFVYVMHRVPKTKRRRDVILQKCVIAILNRIDAVVFPSVNQMKLWVNSGLTTKRAVVIRHGVDTTRFSPEVATAKREAARLNFGFSETDIVVGAALRLSKRVDLMIDAVAILHRKNNRVKALIVGDGKQRADLEAKAKALGLGDIVIFAGSIEDVSAPIAAMDIGLSPADSEVCGLFILECLAMGKPAVMANAVGGPEVIDQGITGGLFVPRSAESIVAQTTPFLDDKVRASSGAIAAKIARDHFSNVSMFNSYDALFAKLTGQSIETSNPTGELKLYGPQHEYCGPLN